MSIDIKSLIMIQDFNDLEGSSQTIENLFLNNKKDITLDLQEYILGESLLYGNYFAYILLDKSLRTKKTDLEMKKSILIRIDNILNLNINNPGFKKQIIEPLEKIKKEINHNFYRRKKMYLYFKEFVLIEFCLINLLGE